MAITTAWKYGAGFVASIGTAPQERLAFSGQGNAIAPISVDAWNPATIITNLAFDTLVAAAKNCRYVSPTQVSLDQASAVTLNDANVSQADCTVKVSWSDSGANTTLSSCKFYVYNGVDPAVAPAGVVVCAFERTATSINKDKVGAPGNGASWNAAGGVGGVTNALKLSDQTSAASHDFYLGISAKPTAYGVNTGMKFRVEFDVA